MKKFTSCSCNCIYFYEMTSTYKLICGEEIRVYGITLYKKGCKDSKRRTDRFEADDVSEDKVYVENLLALFSLNTVLPLHAEEILCECLSVYPSL